MREFIGEQYIPFRSRGWRRAGLTIMAVVAAGSLWASAAHAATLTVTTTGDPLGNSQCSLREAIAAIDAFGTPTVCGTADSSGNTIVLGPHPAYELAPPVVSTGSPLAVTATGAILEGSVLTNNASASVAFEFGQTTAYGSQASAATITGLESVPLAAPLTGLTPGTTYHYRLVATSPDGAAMSPDATFTTAGAPPGAPSITGTPVLTGLSITPASFFAAPTRHHKTGTTIAYTDSLAGQTTIVVFEQIAGVKLHGRCLKPSKRPHGPKCVRLVKLGSFSHSDQAGRNAVRFSGRLGGRKLPPGRYVLELTPQLSGHRGNTVSLRCRVV